LGESVIPIANLNNFKNQDILVAGVVSSIKKIVTRKNDNMIFVKVEDGSSFTELIVFPKVLKQTIDIWQDGQVILVNANVSDKDGETKLLVNKAVSLSLDTLEGDLAEIKNFKVFKKFNNNFGHNFNNKIPDTSSSLPKSLGISFLDKISGSKSDEIKKVLENYPGKSNVYFKVLASEGEKLIKTNFKVNNCPDLKNKLKEIGGDSLEVV